MKEWRSPLPGLGGCWKRHPSGRSGPSLGISQISQWNSWCLFGHPHWITEEWRKSSILSQNNCGERSGSAIRGEVQEWPNLYCVIHEWPINYIDICHCLTLHLDRDMPGIYSQFATHWSYKHWMLLSKILTLHIWLGLKLRLIMGLVLFDPDTYM